MAVEEELRGWEALFAARTRAGAGEGLIAILALAGAEDVISFAGGLPDPATFPGRIVADLLRELVAQGDASPFQYSPTPGLAGPRDFVAGRLERLEGQRPADDELLLTSGTIEALELVGKAFVDKGDTVVVEAPTYLGGIMAFQSFEADVVGIALDDDGLRVDEFEEARPPSLWSLAPQTVVQAGTFSKTFFPGVRLGWAAGPAEIVAKLVWAKQNTDQCAGALGQRLLEEYGRRGHLDEQVGRSRALYRSRCEALLAALDRHLAGRASWTRPRGGFFTWLDVGVDAVNLAERALAAGVGVVPGPPFFADGSGSRYLRLAFSSAAEESNDEGVRRLAALL